jgi:hypothetical protein
VVITTSAADFFLFDGCASTGMPRPSSRTRQPPSASSVTSMRDAWPAMASSMALSTTSHTRWCRPEEPVDPMYMPGRLRTGSRPSSTWISAAVYRPVARLSRAMPATIRAACDGSAYRGGYDTAAMPVIGSLGAR